LRRRIVSRGVSGRENSRFRAATIRRNPEETRCFPPILVTVPQMDYIARNVVVFRQLKRICLNSRLAEVRAWTRQSNFR
jgi:hypothetical protein